MNPDVIVVGAGPAGAVAATLLSRAGARVLLFDRARFPRAKLCGDTLNPGTLAILRRLRLSRGAELAGQIVHGMIVTGPNGVAVAGRYPEGVTGLALARRDLDATLVKEALDVGVAFEEGVAVRAPILATGPSGPTVAGVKVGTNGGTRELRAPVVIAADGRHSSLAFTLNMARHPARPRRWAIGAYFEGVSGVSSFGEMHVRAGRYIGIAAVPGGLTDICLVKPSGGSDPDLRAPAATLTRALADDPLLRERLIGARPIAPPVVLGPLAVDIRSSATIDGLLLAGDASGFVDPMTGDGLRFAIRGAELTVGAALAALAHGWSGVHDRLARARGEEFDGKWRFNRVLRSLVGSPIAVYTATLGARLAPGIVRSLIARAGDCDIALTGSATPT